MRRPSSEPWGFGGAWRPRVECRRGLHMEGGGAMALGCCAAEAIRFPTRTPMGAPISARIPAPMPKTTATITIKIPRKPPSKGTAAKNGARATTTMIPPTVKPRKALRNPNPSDFPISFRRNPVRNPMTSPPIRIQYAPSPAPMKVSSPNTIPSTKPIDQTIPSFILVILAVQWASRARAARRGGGISGLQVDYPIWDGTSSPRRMALRRRRRALSPWPLLAALHAIVLEGMLDRQADPIGPRADPIRLHRRTLRRRVLRRTRRARDVLNLILRHVGREIRHVPEDAEDLLVPQADVVEKRDDRETAHVRDVLVVLDLREEIVHARWEPRDAHLPDVLRLEGLLLRLEDAPELPKVLPEGGDDVVVHRKRKAFLDVPLNRVPHDPERLGPLQGHVPAVHPLVDQFPRRVAHRVRETQEVGEVETEAAVLPSEVHRELRGHVDHKIVGLGFEASFRGDRLPQGEPSDQIRVLQGGNEDPRYRIRQELRALVRRF